ncbi:MAG: hypothetical protein KF746_21325 [Chitinophagaceae bacterium]|nr:hypothetical protein [Chitinophagaceae bacterium]
MAEMKRRTVLFSTGKQMKLFGNSIGIGKTLEVGEGYIPNILSANMEEDAGDDVSMVHNPHKLSREEVMELADFMMMLWLQLKENIRKNGMESSRIFARDTSK